MARTPRKAPDGYKWCSRHGEFLPVSEFGSNTSNSDGLQDYCKLHQAEIARESRERSRDYRITLKLRQLFK